MYGSSSSTQSTSSRPERKERAIFSGKGKGVDTFSVRMAPKPALLVAGGRIKEDLSVGGGELAALGVAKAYTIGECGEAMARAWGGALPAEFAGDLEHACEAAARDVAALRPASVLLAPGTASFDQFRSFEERGDRFAALARRLA